MTLKMSIYFILVYIEHKIYFMFLILIRVITLFENYLWQNFLSFSYSSNWWIALEGERNNGEIYQKLEHNLTYISRHNIYIFMLGDIIYICIFSSMKKHKIRLNICASRY